MSILLIILFILQLVFNIIFLIKSIKTKDNKNWIILFSINVSSIISVALVAAYVSFNDYIEMEGLLYLVLALIALYINLFLLVLNLILKIIQVRKNKKHNIVTKKLEKKYKIKTILIPFILISLSTLSLCGINYSKYVIRQRGELNTYNNVKKKEIRKMTDFIKNKYNINIQEKDCIHYREQDYSRHSDLLGNGGIYNIPYITVFKYNNEKITVVDRKGLISDNRQLKEINDILVNYYYKKTGIKFDYIEFKKSYIGSWDGNDNIINKVLQTKFNSLITDKNIEQFLNYILQEPNLSITFYIKDNNTERLKYNIIKELEYLRKYKNIEVLKVYGYNTNLDIKHKKIYFGEEYIGQGNSSEDYDDGYKFGCYYINNDLNSFTFLLSMYLDRGYTIEDGETIDSWKYSVLNKKEKR